MFKVNQNVWCAIYGAGVVVEVQHTSGGAYQVRFNNGRTCIYTRDGKYGVDSSITLFPYPIEITKAAVKPSIDWNHVSEDFQWLAMDSGGESYLYTDKPQQGEQQWIGRPRLAAATHFASFTPGTCNWRDSLVKRPD